MVVFRQNRTRHRKEQMNEERPLLKLAGELRNRIYNFAVVSTGPIMLRVDSHGNILPEVPVMCKISRRLRSEALPIYYSENIFQLTDGMFYHDRVQRWVRTGGEMLKHLRSIHVFHRHAVGFAGDAHYMYTGHARFKAFNVDGHLTVKDLQMGSTRIAGRLGEACCCAVQDLVVECNASERITTQSTLESPTELRDEHARNPLPDMIMRYAEMVQRHKELHGGKCAKCGKLKGI